MPVMQQKLIQDFFDADEIDRLIAKKQLDIDPGVEILKDLIKKVRDDIRIMDEEKSKILEAKNKELNEKNTIRKKELESKLLASDSIDERNKRRRLLQEDYNRYKQEMLIIQEICYRKGWFD